MCKRERYREILREEQNACPKGREGKGGRETQDIDGGKISWVKGGYTKRLKLNFNNFIIMAFK